MFVCHVASWCCIYDMMMIVMCGDAICYDGDGDNV